MITLSDITIRKLQEKEIDELVRVFTPPWSTPEATRKQWVQYFLEQEKGARVACVLERGKEFLGYGSLLLDPENLKFKENKIPEINSLWIGEKWRHQGLARKLIAYLEDLARKLGYKTVGIAVGLYADYGPAQKLYANLGYMPDGNGATYKGSLVIPGESYPMDDDLLYWSIKALN